MPQGDYIISAVATCVLIFLTYASYCTLIRNLRYQNLHYRNICISAWKKVPSNARNTTSLMRVFISFAVCWFVAAILCCQYAQHNQFHRQNITSDVRQSIPTLEPTYNPTVKPTNVIPLYIPTVNPFPTVNLTNARHSPTVQPTFEPTAEPRNEPTLNLSMNVPDTILWNNFIPFMIIPIHGGKFKWNVRDMSADAWNAISCMVTGVFCGVFRVLLSCALSCVLSCAAHI